MGNVEMPGARVEVFRREDSLWAWRLRAFNGQIVATDGAQGYARIGDCWEEARDVLVPGLRIWLWEPDRVDHLVRQLGTTGEHSEGSE